MASFGSATAWRPRSSPPVAVRAGLETRSTRRRRSTSKARSRLSLESRRRSPSTRRGQVGAKTRSPAPRMSRRPTRREPSSATARSRQSPFTKGDIPEGNQTRPGRPVADQHAKRRVRRRRPGGGGPTRRIGRSRSPRPRRTRLLATEPHDPRPPDSSRALATTWRSGAVGTPWMAMFVCDIRLWLGPALCGGCRASGVECLRHRSHMLLAHPRIGDVAVIGIPSAKWGRVTLGRGRRHRSRPRRTHGLGALPRQARPASNCPAASGSPTSSSATPPAKA